MRDRPPYTRRFLLLPLPVTAENRGYTIERALSFVRREKQKGLPRNSVSMLRYVTQLASLYHINIDQLSLSELFL